MQDLQSFSDVADLLHNALEVEEDSEEVDVDLLVLVSFLESFTELTEDGLFSFSSPVKI